MDTETKNASDTKMSRAERGAQTRQRLLEATIECLAELGYARMSTNDVVRKTGTSRGALAHHFPSKAHLVAEAAAYLINKRITYTMQKIKLLGEKESDRRAELETKWKAYEKWFPANIEFMVASRTDPVLREQFEKSMNAYEADIEEMQQNHLRDGKLTQYVNGCFIRGLCLERLVNPDELIDEIFEEYLRILEAAFSEKQPT